MDSVGKFSLSKDSLDGIWLLMQKVQIRLVDKDADRDWAAFSHARDAVMKLRELQKKLDVDILEFSIDLETDYAKRSEPSPSGA